MRARLTTHSVVQRLPNLGLLPFSIAVILGLLVYGAPANASLIGQTVRFQSTFSEPTTSDFFTVVEGDPLDPGGNPELILFNQFEIDVEEASLREPIVAKARHRRAPDESRSRLSRRP